ncbi:FixH family protein [Neobacillus drentensis]|uniref:FixH family protein n=1 Tax=Neobacillus drentensis TaxID=220684 RepID=UPI002FFD76C0
MMKRLLFPMLLLIAMLAGCSKGPEYEIEVTKDLYFQKDTALPFEIKVTENKKAVKGLDVSAQISMTNMDHGTYDVKLEEGKNGTYSGNVKLPMGGKYEATFTLKNDGDKTEEVINLNVTKPKGVAKINGGWITNDDIAFYQFINKLQLEINREAAKKKYTSKQLEEELAYLDSQEKINDDKNQLLTQIIRLRAMAMLASEKGHKAAGAEVEQAVAKARDQYNQFESSKSLIQEYGEDKFWATEKQQYQLIVLSQKVQKDVIEKVKKDNPNVGEQEVYYLAQKAYEELLVSQVNSLKIEVL